MKILVTDASKHGSTHGIAQAIGTELATCDLEVFVAPVQDVRTIDEFDAVVLGSAIHMGQWMKPAKEFVARETATLASIPVWLFSSGPVADRSKPDGPADRRQGDQIAKTIAAREHRVFRGKIDKHELSLTERAVVRLAKAPSEDQRDWEAIRIWAAEIGAAVCSTRDGLRIVTAPSTSTEGNTS